MTIRLYQKALSTVEPQWGRKIKEGEKDLLMGDEAEIVGETLG